MPFSLTGTYKYFCGVCVNGSLRHRSVRTGESKRLKLLKLKSCQLNLRKINQFFWRRRNARLDRYDRGVESRREGGGGGKKKK